MVTSIKRNSARYNERLALNLSQSSKEQGPRHGYELDHQKTGDYGALGESKFFTGKNCSNNNNSLDAVIIEKEGDEKEKQGRVFLNLHKNLEVGAYPPVKPVRHNGTCRNPEIFISGKCKKKPPGPGK